MAASQYQERCSGEIPNLNFIRRTRICSVGREGFRVYTEMVRGSGSVNKVFHWTGPTAEDFLNGQVCL